MNEKSQTTAVPGAFTTNRNHSISYHTVGFTEMLTFYLDMSLFEIMMAPRMPIYAVLVYREFVSTIFSGYLNMTFHL